MPPFVLQQVADYGSEQPIVARMMMQAIALRGGQAENDEAVFDATWACCQRLMECHKARIRIKEGADDAIAKSIADRLRGVVAIPHVINLEADAPTFLLSAKLYLHAIAGLILKLYGSTDFLPDAKSLWTQKGKKPTAVTWAEASLGVDSRMTKILVAFDPLVAELVKWRNAHEHAHEAKCLSGRIDLRNFRLENGMLIRPQWRRVETGDEILVDVDSQLAEWEADLLNLGEQVIVIGSNDCLLPLMTVIPIAPEAIDPAQPYRYKLTARGNEHLE